MKIRVRIIGLTILLSACQIFAAGRGESAAEQQLLIQSVVDEAESAARRGDAKTAQSLVQQAYTDFAQYNKVSDEKKFEALGKIEEAARLASRAQPKQPERKVSAANIEKERSILKTWLQNIKNIFDEKQAIDLYERAKRDAAKFKYMSEEEIQNILQQIRNYTEFLRPAPKPVKQPTQQERKKEEGGKIIAPGGPAASLQEISLQDADAIKRATANRAKLSQIDRIELNEKLGNAIDYVQKPQEEYFKDVELLLEEGADPNFAGNVSMYQKPIAGIILTAIQGQSKEFIRRLFTLLKKYRFDFNSQPFGEYGGPLLVTAAHNSYSSPLMGNPDLYNEILLLLEFGANPNAQNGNKDASLHMLGSITAYSNAQNLELVKNFIAHGADINLPGYKGMTPLRRAIGQGNFSFARALMHYGANPFITDDKQQTPLQFLNSAVKNVKNEKESAAKKNEKLPYDPDKEIQRLEESKKELEAYMKDYKKRHAKEIAEAIGCPAGVGGIAAEFMFGEEPKSEAEKE